MPKFEPVDSATLALAHEIIDEYHPWLLDANIMLVFREGNPPRRGGNIILGAASLVDDRMRVVAAEEYDFFIWLLAEWWQDAPDADRRALLDHELCHCIGEPGAWKLRGHDIEEFVAIVRRHGAWKHDLRVFAEAVLDIAQDGAFRQPDLFDTEPRGRVATIAGGQCDLEIVSAVENATNERQ